jgi:predicted nucleic acid-binding protein
MAVFRLVIPASSAVLDRARGLHTQGCILDAMIMASCLAAGVKVLYSEDLPGGDVEGLSVVNPFK